MNTNECPICYESINIEGNTLCCKHEIHSKCMFKYGEQHIKMNHNNYNLYIPCPICRQEHHIISNFLFSIIRKGELDDLKEIINKDNINNKYGKWELNTLHIASSVGNINTIKYLLELGTNINSISNQGHTPVYNATLLGRFEIVKYLVEQGADINIKHFSEKTPLDVALECKYFNIVEYLWEMEGISGDL